MFLIIGILKGMIVTLIIAFMILNFRKVFFLIKNIEVDNKDKEKYCIVKDMLFGYILIFMFLNFLLNFK